MIQRLLDALLHVVFSLQVLFRRRFICVDVATQKMYLFAYGRCVKTYVVSTAKNGVGEQEGSFKTPRGWFCVAERYGDDEPIDMVFKGRKAIASLSELVEQCEDPILARILRLSGRQIANANTFHRYVYIHGAEDSRMDKNRPLSLGCVNMYASDMVDLFEEVSGVNHLWVYIVDRGNLLPWQPCLYPFV